MERLSGIEGEKEKQRSQEKRMKQLVGVIGGV